MLATALKCTFNNCHEEIYMKLSYKINTNTFNRLLNSIFIFDFEISVC